MKALTQYHKSTLVAPYATKEDAEIARRLVLDVEERVKVLIAQEGTLYTNTWEKALREVVAAYAKGAAPSPITHSPPMCEWPRCKDLATEIDDYTALCTVHANPVNRKPTNANIWPAS